MAYREFHNEKYYEAPDVPANAYGNTLDTIAEIFRSNAEAKKKKALAADQYKFDLGQGKFENDDKIFFQRALNITERSRQDLRGPEGRISSQVQKDAISAQEDKKSSDWQFQAMTDMTKSIEKKSAEDKYYDPDVDLNGLKEAAYGKDNDVYYATRGDRMADFSKRMFKNPTSLRGKLYTSDYAKLQGTKENGKVSGDPNYKSSVYSSTPFLLPSGIPGVTVDHAKQYLSSRSDGSVARWVENLVDQDMQEELAYNREKNSKLKGMNDQEAILYLKAHPEENASNKKLYADRVIERAQYELMEASNVNRKVDYETKVDKSITNGLYSNDNVGHSYTEHTDDFGTEAAGSDLFVTKGLTQSQNDMPGGTLRIAKGAKVGQAIPLDLNPQYMVNMRNGKLIENRGSSTFNLTGYQMTAYDVHGKPKIISREAIKYIPNSAFANLSPDLGMALRGYTVNTGNKLGEVAARQSDLDGQLADAIASKDEEAEESIRRKIEDLGELKNKLQLSPNEVSDDDLMSTFKQNGISINSIKQDMLIKPSQADLGLIDKNLTRGLDLTDPNKWSPEMKEMQALWRKKYEAAKAAGFKDPGGAKKPSGAAPAAGKVRVETPDGKKGYIPANQLEDALKQGYKKLD